MRQHEENVVADDPELASATELCNIILKQGKKNRKGKCKRQGGSQPRQKEGRGGEHGRA